MKLQRTLELAQMKPNERTVALSPASTAPPNISPRLTKEEARKKEKKRRKKEERRRKEQDAAVSTSPRSPRDGADKEKKLKYHKARPAM